MENEEYKKALADSVMMNAKLAEAVKLMMGYHMTSSEKETLAKRIDACASAEDIEGTTNLIQKELHKGFLDEESGERWSPSFVNEIKRYYEEGFPFNPTEKLKKLFITVKEHIVLQDTFTRLNDEQKEAIQEQVKASRSECLKAMREIDTSLDEMTGQEPITPEA